MMHDGASGAGQCAATSAASSGVRNTKPAGLVKSWPVAREPDDRIVLRGRDEHAPARTAAGTPK